MTQDLTRATVIGLMMLLGWFAPEASAMLNPSQGRFMQRDPLGYVDGMSVYEYLRSSPTGLLDPTGENGLRGPDHFKAAECECPCIQNPADCFIGMSFLALNDMMPRLDGTRAPVKQYHTKQPIQAFAFAFDNCLVRSFFAGAAVHVWIDSLSGRDVTLCNLRQTRMEVFSRLADGRLRGEHTKPDSPDGFEKDSVYGGSWFYDYPNRQSFHAYPTKQGVPPGEVAASVFWQALVEIVEAPEVRMYWGFKARADFGIVTAMAKKEKDKQAMVEYVTWGPRTAPEAPGNYGPGRQPAR